MRYTSITLLAWFTLAICSAQDAYIQDLRQRADKGEAQAQYCLALAYDTGRGVPENFAESGKLYRLAAEQGHAGAQKFLGTRYHLNSQDNPENLIEAYKWLALSAAQGDKRSEQWRDNIKDLLTDAQLRTAQARAAAFVPKPTPATKAWLEAQAKAKPPASPDQAPKSPPPKSPLI